MLRGLKKTWGMLLYKIGLYRTISTEKKQQQISSYKLSCIKNIRKSAYFVLMCFPLKGNIM